MNKNQEGEELQGNLSENEMNNKTEMNEDLGPEEKVLSEDVNHQAEKEKLEHEVKEWNDKYLRLYSEFDNYRKRVSKERLDLIKSAGTEIISSLLPILDDFDRAGKSFENTQDLQALREGVTLIHQKLKSLLEQKGLKEMNTMGKDFDTDLHDAVTNTPAPSEDLKGKVVDELQKGYFLNEKVIRHAKVVVGQ